MTEPRIYRKQMKDIRRGEVVAGAADGWWRVTEVDHDGNDTVVLVCVNTVTGRAGELYGHADDWRDLVTC